MVLQASQMLMEQLNYGNCLDRFRVNPVDGCDEVGDTFQGIIMYLIPLVFNEMEGILDQP